MYTSNKTYIYFTHLYTDVFIYPMTTTLVNVGLTKQDPSTLKKLSMIHVKVHTQSMEKWE